MYQNGTVKFRRSNRQILGIGTPPASDDPQVIQQLGEFAQSLAQMAFAAQEFSGLSKHVARNRFCITERGRAAIVPPKTQKGDVIALLAGARMPFLLRPCGKAFELIGCCYVHGLMEGGDFDDGWTLFGLM